MFSNKYFFLKILVICSISLSFFLGYFLRENATGGGLEFYKLSWPIIQSLKKDFFFTINNYATFGDGTIPFSHIINAYLNPFSNVDAHLQLFTTLLSFLIFLIFAAIFKKNFNKINFIDILLTSSVILILPFYRTSAFWGKNENYGWLFFIIALYFFFEIKKSLNEAPNNREIFKIFLFCFTSACALYARQALIFLPISYLLYLLINNSHKKIILISLFFFFIFAIPGILLFITWGGLYDVNNLDSNTFYGEWIHPKYIFQSMPIILSFFGFYLLPILIIEFFHTNYKIFFKKYLKNFIFILLFFIFLYQINLLSYLGNFIQGGGAILKLNYLIQKNNYFLFLIFSSIGFSILISFFREEKNNIIILLPMLLIYSFRNPYLQYQEYYEPLILVIFFLILKTNLHKIYLKNISFSNFILLSYFGIYLFGSIYFKHFIFDSLEKWKIFLNVQ